VKLGRIVYLHHGWRRDGNLSVRIYLDCQVQRAKEGGNQEPPEEGEASRCQRGELAVVLKRLGRDNDGDAFRNALDLFMLFNSSKVASLCKA
jgi:hypothetical protein